MEATRSTRVLAAIRQAIARRAEESEEGAESGFTLIELMVVLLIMAILLAIAIPTFLGVKGGAQDRSAQSDLTNAITAAKAYYTNNTSYPTGVGAAAAFSSAMSSSEPELTWGNTVTSSSPNDMSFALSADGFVLILASKSQSGRCWFAEDNEESSQTNDGVGGTTQGVSYAELGANSTTACDASNAPTTGWSSSYPAPS
ncbi:MAG: type IV pilin protein [Acidimicrobiales bacterium]